MNNLADLVLDNWVLALLQDEPAGPDVSLGLEGRQVRVR